MMKPTGPGKLPTVLHIFSGDLWAGAEVMIHSLLAQLNLDDQVRLIALSMNEGVLTGKLRAGGVETHVIPEARFSFPHIFLRAARLLRSGRIDIIHSHRYKENLLAILLGKCLRVKGLIATVHGLPEATPSHEGPSHLLTRLDTFLLQRCFSHVVAVSHDIKSRMTNARQFTNGSMSVIHNGIPPVQCSPPSDNSNATTQTPHGIHIGSVGRLVPVKDFTLFLEIAARITQDAENVRFSILGDGPCRGEIEEKADRLGLNGRFSLLSPRQDPVPYYRTLDIYLNTSLYEGIPMSVLEAMACGVPVVAPRVGGLSEIISDSQDGFLVEGRNPEGYARRCVDVIRDANLRTRIRESASRRIQSEFSAARMAQDYSSRYVSLLQSQS